MKKRIIGLLMVLWMVAALCSGCGSNSDDSTSKKAPATGGSGENKNPDASDAGTNEDEVVNIKMMANLYLAELGIADKAFLNDLKENVGVDLDIEIPPSSGYAEKLQLMLVSGQYPDVVMFQSTNSDSYLNALDSGVLLPLNDYLDKAPNLMEHTYEASWKSLTTDDGHVYGIPRTSVTRAVVSTLEKIG